MLGHVENLIVNPDARDNDRLIAWWCALSSWGVLRFDDHTGMSPICIEDFDDGWTLHFSRTKTIGKNKVVELRRATVGNKVYVHQLSWMRVGYQH